MALFPFLALFLLWPGALAFTSIRFSPISQCGQFNVTFSGADQLPPLPLSLTVVPFNSTPLSIPIPDPHWDAANQTGAVVTFLPFPAGTQFVASLDDANGISTGHPSDVINILPSDNDTCLTPQYTEPTPDPFHPPTELAQCEPFTVDFNQSTAGKRSIRAFIPKVLALHMNETGSNATTTTFLSNVIHGFTAVLLLDDGLGTRQTSQLIAVSGNSGSNSSCLPSLASANHSQSKKKKSDGDAALAAGVAAAGIVGSILVLLAIYFFRRRVRLRQAQQPEFQYAESGYNGTYPGYNNYPNAYAYADDKPPMTFGFRPDTPNSTRKPSSFYAFPTSPSRSVGRRSPDARTRASSFIYSVYDVAEDWQPFPQPPAMPVPAPASAPTTEALPTRPPPIAYRANASSGLVPRGGSLSVPQSAAMPESATLARSSTSVAFNQVISSTDIERALEMATLYNERGSTIDSIFGSPPGPPALPSAPQRSSWLLIEPHKLPKAPTLTPVPPAANAHRRMASDQSAVVRGPPRRGSLHTRAIGTGSVDTMMRQIS